MRVIAFYTKDTPYEKEAERWMDSFKTCKTACYIMHNQGSWEKNCGMKSEVLLKAFEDYNEPLLYTDIDAILCRPLEDIPIPDLPGLCWWNPTWAPHLRELCSGTIYIPHNDAGLEMLQKWNAFQKKHPTMWDQRALQYVVERDDIPHQILSWNWISIDTHIKPENPIIHHTQASRRLKRVINEG